jgi:adenine-specific DNA-methyltransferase
MGIFLNEDCVIAMNKMADKSVNLVVTSPPYNADKAYGTYDDSGSLEKYKDFAKKWVGCLPRILSDNGGFWLNVGYTKLSDTETLPLTYLYYPLLIEAGFHFIQEIVWHYEGGMAYKRRYAHRTERWMWCVKDPKNFIFNLDAVRDASLNRTQDKRNHPMGKNPTDYWYYDRVVGGTGASADKTAHPCQFPVSMVERIIKSCSNAKDVVLDPFGGSGSTALAAVNQDRNFISVELDKTFHDISQERIASSHKMWLTTIGTQ